MIGLSCIENITPCTIAFDAVSIVPIRKDFRDEVFSALKICVEDSNAALGLLIKNESLVAYSLHSCGQLQLTVTDIMLLLNFVSNSSSLKSHDQNWVPICLPAFNAGAYLQANFL